MNNNMNSPVEYNWKPEDVLNDYEKYKDKKKVAKIYGITPNEVLQIIKNGVVINKIELTKEEMDFILKYRGLSKEDREKVQRALKGDVECLKMEKSDTL